MQVTPIEGWVQTGREPRQNSASIEAPGKHAVCTHRIPMQTLYTLSVSPLALQFLDVFRELDIAVTHFDSARNLHRALKTQKPDIFIGEFVYAWGNDYAGNTLSNLDVTLRTLQAVAPRAKRIVVMQASEAAHINKLLAVFPLHATLILPCTADALRTALKDTPD